MAVAAVVASAKAQDISVILPRCCAGIIPVRRCGNTVCCAVVRALRSAHFWLSIGVLASQHRAASAQPEPLRARESASASKPELADVHARPRALLQNPRDGLLYIALSTQNQVAVIDTKTRQPQLLFRINTGPFPQSLALSPSGDVLVVCRYDSAVGVIPQQPQMLTPQQRYRRWPAGPVYGLRDIAVQPRSGLAYVSTPALDGVQAFHEQRGVVQTVRTGLGARVVRVVQDPQRSGQELLLVILCRALGHDLCAGCSRPHRCIAAAHRDAGCSARSGGGAAATADAADADA